MSLHLHRAERADTLATALAEVLAEPLPDPFATELVCVPTRGVERWLAQRLSHRLGVGSATQDGVCAGISFPSPRRLLAGVVDQALEIEVEDPWHPRRATWPLLTVIDRSRGEPWAEHVWSFLGDDPARPDAAIDPVRGGRRWWLAQHTAGLFARYATTRPQMITAWSQGRDVGPDGGPLPSAYAWQAEAWRRLAAEIGGIDPVQRLQRATQMLRESSITLDLPERLSVFGATRIDRDQLAVLDALAAHRDIHLWLPHPSPVLWSAVRDALAATSSALGPRSGDHTAALPRNRLLGYLGRDSRELQLVLAAAEPASDQHHPGPPPGSDSLLHRLQSGLIDDAAPQPAEARPPLDPADRSLSVHSCHGPDRQVEVLREVLLGLLADDPTLEPRDVIVMCPDIERFAPLIAATFGLDPESETAQTPEHPGHQLRVRLADRSLQRLNPLLAVLARVFELVESRWTASSVVDFASMEPVARRFGFTDDERERLIELVGRSGVRWGLDAPHRQAYGMGAFGQNTWAAGLDRLLLGVAMDEDGQHSIGTALPLDDIDSSLVDLVGRLTELLARLQHWTQVCAGRHPASTWLRVCREVIDSLTATGSGDRWQIAHAYGELNRLATPVDGADPELSLREVRAMLADALRGRASRSNFRTGTLTVCTMLPMRSVPHRVVCVLGADDGVFPRRLRPDGDDLTAVQEWIGDHDSRSVDRQLLLDAVMAATEHFVILFGGTDNRTGAAQPPAVPIGELLDALELIAVADGRTVREAVTTRHPLQPFDPANFIARADDRKRFSFDTASLRGARAASGPPDEPRRPYAIGLLPPADHGGLIGLDDLVRFFSHPARFLLQKRANLPTWNEDDELDDTMPVGLDGLEAWAVGERMLRDHLAGAGLDELAAAEWRRGTLPPRQFGANAVRPIIEGVAELAASAQPYLSDDPGSRDLVIEGGAASSLVVSGTVGPLHGDRLLTVTYATLSARHRLSAWIRLLALTAGAPGREWQAVTIGRRGISVQGPIDPGFASLALADLVDLYLTGLREPIPFAPKTSAQYAALRHQNRSVELWRPKLAQTWEREVDDVWRSVLDSPELEALMAALTLDHEVRGTLGEPTRFGTLARRVFHPLLSAEALA